MIVLRESLKRRTRTNILAFLSTNVTERQRILSREHGEYDDPVVQLGSLDVIQNHTNAYLIFSLRR